MWIQFLAFLQGKISRGPFFICSTPDSQIVHISACFLPDVNACLPITSFPDGRYLCGDYVVDVAAVGKRVVALNGIAW
jgi:hypothetical protein